MNFIPLLLSLWGMGLVLARRYSSHDKWIVFSGVPCFTGGVVGSIAVASLFPGDLVFVVARSIVGGAFALFSLFALLIIFRNGWGWPGTPSPSHGRALSAAGAAGLAGTLAGLVTGCRLPLGLADTGAMPVALAALCIAVAGFVVAVMVTRLLPARIIVTTTSLFSLVISLLLFASSSIPRLDLFSPLTMKVMKFIHDFVHQFFESMLIPDHGFFRRDVWEYIGLLFSNGVGFWGGLVIWFTPAILVLLAIRRERLPSVAHIRQGAARRLVLAAGIRERRCRLVVAACSLLLLSAAVYESRFPAVEYWDPKPIVVAADGSGNIVLPVSGEISLRDGKLHKYLFRQGERQARFFIVKNDAGNLTVDLDACSICKPDGYGQTAGALICYYCKTLIPLETVGKPGGCNPVPVAFTATDKEVRIDGRMLLNLWSETVQATTRVKKGVAP